MCCGHCEDITDDYFEQEHYEHYSPLDDNHILIPELDVKTPYAEAPFRSTEDE